MKVNVIGSRQTAYLGKSSARSFLPLSPLSKSGYYYTVPDQFEPRNVSPFLATCVATSHTKTEKGSVVEIVHFSDCHTVQFFLQLATKFYS